MDNVFFISYNTEAALHHFITFIDIFCAYTTLMRFAYLETPQNMDISAKALCKPTFVRFSD